MGAQACELCGKRSTLLCLADEAKLCWDCDASVHCANFLVARHVRSLLCKHCGNETECQTSGSHPSPLERSCAACDPAYVNDAVKVKEPNVKECMALECDDDSDNLRATAAPLTFPKSAIGRGMDCSPPSQESHTHSRSTTGDVQSSTESQGQCKRARWSTGRTCDTKKVAFGAGHASGAQPAKKGRFKRSQSPVSVISQDVSDGTCDREDPVESLQYSSLAART